MDQYENITADQSMGDPAGMYPTGMYPTGMYPATYGYPTAPGCGGYPAMSSMPIYGVSPYTSGYTGDPAVDLDPAPFGDPVFFGRQRFPFFFGFPFFRPFFRPFFPFGFPFFPPFFFI